MAGGSLKAAEIAQVQRSAPVNPPLCHLGVVAAEVREQAAEDAKIKAA